jgi:SAM-dependent methyltransferase
MRRDKNIWENYWQSVEDRSWWRHAAPEVVEFIASQSPKERPSVLDLGCGLGRHAIAFAQAGFSVTAIDSSKHAISQLADQTRELSLAIRGLVCDVSSELLSEDGFDIVLAYNVIYHGYRHEFAAAIGRVRRLLKTDGLFYFTCPTRDDGKYGYGEEVAPHTFLCKKSITPGDIHYFANDEDLDELLSGFVQLRREKKEGHFDNKGIRQFYSYWHVLARKS